MPGSVKHGKQNIKEFVHSLKDVKTIVDVGPGSGTYAELLGDKYKYIGIEIFEDYIERFDLDSLYEDIIIADIYDIASDKVFPKGDLIIFGDVLEHLNKRKAQEVLDRALITYKHVVVSIPLGKYPGAVHYGNIHEKHISTWSFEEVKERGKWELALRAKDIGIFCK